MHPSLTLTHSSYEYYSICMPKCCVMSCTSVPRVLRVQEERTSPPSTCLPPTRIVLLLLYYSTLAMYLCPLYVSDVKSTSNNPSFSNLIKLANRISSQIVLLHLFFLLGRDYIPITFINAREIDKQTEDVVEILYTI